MKLPSAETRDIFGARRRAQHGLAAEEQDVRVRGQPDTRSNARSTRRSGSPGAWRPAALRRGAPRDASPRPAAAPWPGPPAAGGAAPSITRSAESTTRPDPTSNRLGCNAFRRHRGHGRDLVTDEPLHVIVCYHAFESANSTRSRPIMNSSPFIRCSQIKSRNGSAPGSKCPRFSCWRLHQSE